MLTNHDSDWNIDNFTETEIYAAIRYLEPDPRSLNEQDTGDDHKDNGTLICVCLYLALLACLAFLWFYST